MRHLAVGFACSLALVVSGHAQDSGASTAPDLYAQFEEAGALDESGRPIPSFWSFDSEAPARDWLGKPPMDPADLAARPEAYAEALAELGLLLDPAERTLSVRGAMLHDNTTLPYPIEYLVVTEMGSTYEAAVLIRTPPSVIDACLKALSLTAGEATRILRKEPQPAEADIRSGRVSPWRVQPAHGPLLEIDVSWIDTEGRPHEIPLESLLLDAGTLQPLEPAGWIYTGSERFDLRQGSKTVNWYKADVEGDVVAIYLADARVCLLERNSLAGVSDTQYYALNPELAPAVHTPVTLSLRVLGRDVEAREPIDGLVFFPPMPEEPPVGRADDVGEAPANDASGEDDER